MTIEEDLVGRYEAVLRAGQKNPYYTSKAEWVRDVQVKILELKSIINRGKN